MPNQVQLKTCSEVQYLFEDSGHMNEVYGLGTAFGCGTMIALFIWAIRKKNQETKKRLEQPVTVGVVLLMLSLFCLFFGSQGHKMRLKLQAHCKTAYGQIIERRHISRPSRWVYKYTYRADGIRYVDDYVHRDGDASSLPPLEVDSQYYLVVFDSTEPDKSILDASKPLSVK